MNMRDLIPWGRNGNVSRYREADQNPFLALHREVNRLFDDVFRSFEGARGFSRGFWGSGWPSIEIADGDKEIRVTAEVPGLEEKDVEVLLDDDVLVIQGERRSETEDRSQSFSERFYGRFERRIPLGSEVEQDKASADFRNGVLTVTLPKSPEAKTRTKRIAIGGKH